MKSTLRWLILFTALNSVLSGECSTHQVGAGKVKTIADGLKLCQVHDTLYIMSGTYFEHSLIIDKPMTIIGKGRPVVDGMNEGVQLLIIAADSVLVEGITLQNTGFSFLQDLAAIKVKRAKYGRIQDVHILNSFFGIYLEYAKHYTLINNKIQGQITNEANAGNAIHIWKGDFITVKGNELTGHRDGIYFEFVNESSISHNNSHHNIRYGLHFMFSNNDEYLNNTFSENSAGVAVMFSNHILMKSNKFALNWGGASYGLLLKEISDGEISDNLFYKNTIGILAEGANRLLIERNQFTSNGSALNMKGNCLDNKIAYNNFLANTFEVVTNSRYSQNTYSHNYWSKYKSYDLNRDGIGDEPYRPVEIFSKVTDVIPASTILLHSFLIDMLNLGERLFPEVIPADLIDLKPMIKPHTYDRHSAFK